MTRPVKTAPNELAPPPGAYRDPNATEILRAWVVNKGLEVSVIKAFEDPGMWGLLLVDLARHAARIYEQEKVCGFEQALSEIRKMADAEWNRPTDMGTTTTHRKQ